jgi:hypothetical protein
MKIYPRAAKLEKNAFFLHTLVVGDIQCCCSWLPSYFDGRTTMSQALHLLYLLVFGIEVNEGIADELVGL